MLAGFGSRLAWWGWHPSIVTLLVVANRVWPAKIFGPTPSDPRASLLLTCEVICGRACHHLARKEGLYNASIHADFHLLQCTSCAKQYAGSQMVLKGIYLDTYRTGDELRQVGPLAVDHAHPLSDVSCIAEVDSWQT
jgi:hypothetical protein